MKKWAMAGLIVTLAGGAAGIKGQETPKQPGPLKEHVWLRQVVGEWDSGGPGSDKGKFSESIRMLGDLWIVAETKGTNMDKSMTGMLTLGYDPQKKKYVGTWIDSSTSYLWKYEGSVDAAGKVLTLETEGPNPSAPGRLFKFKDVHELKSEDHKVLTSSMLGEDGKWFTFVTLEYRRKK